MDLYTPEEMDMGVNHGDNDEPVSRKYLDEDVPMPDMSIERMDVDGLMNWITTGNREGRFKPTWNTQHIKRK